MISKQSILIVLVHGFGDMAKGIDFKKALKEITEIYDLGGMNIDSLSINS